MNPITISAVTTHIVNLFEGDERLRDVWLLGEVSNWKKAASGHIYFSLKDAGASLSGVMWKGNAFRHTWLPREGDQVMAHGYVGVYPERGSYQFYADEIRPAGRGQLYAQFEALKGKLAAEGLFDAESKRPIPAQARRLGVVTSPGAAALRDVLRVLSQRWPLVEVILFPTLVQGNDAPGQIVAALEAASRFGNTGSLFDGEPLDTILLVRGGGSIEDLWAFNDEGVARAVAASRVPVIVGVGHETDFTIVDFVADLRAPTPSAAAAAAVPDRWEMIEQLQAVQFGLVQRADVEINRAWERLETLRSRLHRASPQRQIDLARQRLVEREERLHGQMAQRLTALKERLAFGQVRLESLNPTAVLGRGYSIVQNVDGAVVTGPAGAAVGDSLRVRGAGGEYNVRRE
ncbi:MAG: exodeoxyribonuclease VII large subunit [Caldilineaceae bacterium]|nr:exodeoxyribonuclease VII large subunit [Caldilineaceae bacterium]